MTRLADLLEILDRFLPPVMMEQERWNARIGVLISAVVSVILLLFSPLWAFAIHMPGVGVACAITALLFGGLAMLWGRLGHRNALVAMLALCFVLETFAVTQHGGHQSPFLPLVLFPVLYAALLGSTRIAAATAVIAIAYVTAFNLAPASLDFGTPPDAGRFWLIATPPMVILGGSIVAAMAGLRASAQIQAQHARDDAVDARGEAEAALLEAERASRAKSDFLAIASHEMRSPLAGILGAAELLLHETDDPASVKHWAEIISTSGKRMAELVDDLLDLKRIERGDIRIEDKAFVPRELIREVTALLTQAPKSREVTLVVAFGPNLADAVKGDGTRVRQILLNLLGNALKFAPTGDIFITASGALTIEVRDEGSGVNKEIQDTVFDPFVRADVGPDRRSNGTGLGLAISRRLAKAMGGDLELLASDTGAHFKLTLPLEPCEPPAPRPATPAAASRLTILVVDDDPLTRGIAVRMLQHAGYHPEEAESGEGAIEHCARTMPDAVLLDWHMPGLDGFETAKHLQNAHPDLPLLGFTASTAPEEHRRASESGMHAVLRKPMSLRSLATALAELG